MSRKLRIALTIVFCLTYVSQPAHAAGFKNCTELRKKFPKGVALTVAAASKTGAKLDPATYRANSKMDRDKDKVACES